MVQILNIILNLEKSGWRQWDATPTLSGFVD